MMNKLPSQAYNGCLNEDWIRTEEYKMGEYALSFNELQKYYYSGEVGDKKIAEYTTQQQYYSMLLNKRRLQRHNLIKQISVSMPKSDYLRIPMKKEGNILSGQGEYHVKIVRDYYMDNKKIYSQKSLEVNHIHLLKYNVMDGCISCPNCGKEGSVEKFSAGCEYCGASFEVKTFEPKVSFFSLIDDSVKNMPRPLFYVTALVSSICLVAFVLLFGLEFLQMLFKPESAMSDVFDWLSALLLKIFAPTFVCTSYCTFISIVVSMLMLCVHKKVLKYKNIVGDCIKNISYQELEQRIDSKIRYIYMANSQRDISAMVRADVEEFIEAHHNVVDLSVQKIIFKKCSETSNNYRIDLEAIVKLYIYKKKRIKIKYERVRMALLGRKGVVDKYKYSSIMAYKCESCGSSINVLMGGTCSMCGRQYQYENKDWIVSEFAKGKNVWNPYKWIGIIAYSLLILILAYVVNLILHSNIWG